jgi:methylglutaconyl-CoA hydratase
VTHHQFLEFRREGPVEYLTLNRPEVRNALSEAMVQELTAWAERAHERSDVRAVVLAGAGPIFCAGADTSWFLKTAQFTTEQNRQDAMALSRMFAALDKLPIPLIGRVQGAALGGGAGLAAVCDIVVADDQAVFAFTEVKLGLLPGVISPFVLAKIGRSAARDLFLTGARFSAGRAREIGLVHAVVAGDELDAAVGAYLKEILGAGPEAIAEAKALIQSLWNMPVDEAAPIASAAIARRRVSAEGQEGLRAFSEKRKPAWRIQ